MKGKSGGIAGFKFKKRADGGATTVDSKQKWGDPDETKTAKMDGDKPADRLDKGPRRAKGGASPLAPASSSNPEGDAAKTMRKNGGKC